MLRSDKWNRSCASQELTVSRSEEQAATEALSESGLNADVTIAGAAPRKALKSAVIRIVIAAISMLLDNVLAVAGAAYDHREILVFGLILSVALMGVASTFIARLLHRHRWIGWVGPAGHSLRSREDGL